MIRHDAFFNSQNEQLAALALRQAMRAISRGLQRAAGRLSGGPVKDFSGFVSAICALAKVARGGSARPLRMSAMNEQKLLELLNRRSRPASEESQPRSVGQPRRLRTLGRSRRLPRRRPPEQKRSKVAAVLNASASPNDLAMDGRLRGQAGPRRNGGLRVF
jgi:hypothetical protein